MQEKFKLSDDTVTTDKNVISEKFIVFFVNIGNNLARKIPDVNTSAKQYMEERIIQSIFLDIVTTEDINKVIGSLKKCSGIWWEYCWYLASIIEYLNEPLYVIYAIFRL